MSESDYYNRKSGTNSDGSPLFTADKDKDNEAGVIEVIERAWSCKIMPFGMLCPVDFYALRDNRIAGVIELKSRDHESSKYSTTWLNFRKWISLVMAEVGLGCPGIFVVKFHDRIGFIKVADINPRDIQIGGCRHIVKSKTDIEPMINVPIANLTWIT